MLSPTLPSAYARCPEDNVNAMLINPLNISSCTGDKGSDVLKMHDAQWHDSGPLGSPWLEGVTPSRAT